MRSLGARPFPPSRPGTQVLVNMMPFKLEPELKTLPSWLRSRYGGLILSCPVPTWGGRVAYLTVQESFVGAGRTQRRPGVHTDGWGGGGGWGGGWWGGGGGVRGGGGDGIFVGSDVGQTTRVWPCVVAAAPPGGSCEELRSSLGPGRLLSAQELCWLTDCTPHESCAAAGGPVWRQFFRLVAGPISAWFCDTSSANPAGVRAEAPSAWH